MDLSHHQPYLCESTPREDETQSKRDRWTVSGSIAHECGRVSTAERRFYTGRGAGNGARFFRVPLAGARTVLGISISTSRVETLSPRSISTFTRSRPLST